MVFAARETISYLPNLLMSWRTGNVCRLDEAPGTTQLEAHGSVISPLIGGNVRMLCDKE